MRTAISCQNGVSGIGDAISEAGKNGDKLERDSLSVDFIEEGLGQNSPISQRRARICGALV